MDKLFGPWATAIHDHERAQLGAFWKQRLSLLPALSRPCPPGGAAAAGMLIGTILFTALPTLLLASAGRAPSDRTPSDKDAPPAARPDHTAWGDTAEGLQAGMRFADERPAYRTGETVRFEVVVRNVGERRIAFSHLQVVVVGEGTDIPVAGMFHEFPPTVIDRRGREVEIPTGAFNTGRVPVKRHSLGPGETATIGQAVLALESPGWRGPVREPTLVAGAGAYRVSQRFWIQRQPGVNEALTTGILDLRVVDAAEAAAGVGGWSAPVNSLEARLALVERARLNGTRQLIPYLDLRNAGDSAAPLRVHCDGGHVKFELVDADGKVLRDGSTLPRSGPHADPGTIVLPHDSSIRVGMHCTNWGVPKDAAAMISTDSGAWVLQEQEQGRVFLRVTLSSDEEPSDSARIWHGSIQATVAVDWSGPEPQP